MRIAFLACPQTLPGSPQRRNDAFEHDQTLDNLQPAFAAHNASLYVLSWDDEQVDWSQFDAAIIGTTWDYQHRYAHFITALDHISNQTQLFNPLALVQWNSRKSYLRDLADQGIGTIPTLWFDQADDATLEQAFATFNSEQIVLKRQVGAGAEGQYLIKRGAQTGQVINEPVMLQPFLSSVATEGEISLIFIDGDFSHALLKKPKTGDYRIQTIYGGYEEIYQPQPAELSVAERVLQALPDKPLYARVDLIRGDEGQCYLIELELIEPFLYPLQGPQLGQRLYTALQRRLQK